MSDKKKPLSSQQIDSCKRLRGIWERKKRQLQLTQEKAAEALSVSVGAINHYLNARNALNVEVVAKWSTLLQVRPTDIDPVLGKVIEDAQRATLPPDARRIADRFTEAAAKGELTPQALLILDKLLEEFADKNNTVKDHGETDISSGTVTGP